MEEGRNARRGLEDNEVGYRRSIEDIGWKSVRPDFLDLARVVAVGTYKAGRCRCLARADHMERRALEGASRTTT